MSRLCRGLCAALLLLLPLGAYAQSGAPLQEEEVRRFLATLPALEELGERHADTGLQDAEIDPEAGFAPMAAALSELRGHEAYGEFQSIVHGEGFDDEDRWAEVGDRTLRAYMALQLTEEHPGMLDELQGALEQLDSNPDMSDEQRAMMVEMLGPAVALARSIEDVPEDDLRVTEALRPEIDAVVEQ